MTSIATIYIVDDDTLVLDRLQFQLEHLAINIQAFTNGESFLNCVTEKAAGCLILDVKMPDMTGIELQKEMDLRAINLPIIFHSGYGDIPTAVKTLHAGAVNFLTKPVEQQELIKCVLLALDLDAKNKLIKDAEEKLNKCLNQLTSREVQVCKFMIKGDSTKQIASKLNISIRTVDSHRSNILDKTKMDNFFQVASLYSKINHK